MSFPLERDEYAGFVPYSARIVVVLQKQEILRIDSADSGGETVILYESLIHHTFRAFR